MIRYLAVVGMFLIASCSNSTAPRDAAEPVGAVGAQAELSTVNESTDPVETATVSYESMQLWSAREAGEEMVDAYARRDFIAVLQIFHPNAQRQLLRDVISQKSGALTEPGAAPWLWEAGDTVLDPLLAFDQGMTTAASEGLLRFDLAGAAFTAEQSVPALHGYDPSVVLSGELADGRELSVHMAQSASGRWRVVSIAVDWTLDPWAPAVFQFSPCIFSGITPLPGAECPLTDQDDRALCSALQGLQFPYGPFNPEQIDRAELLDAEVCMGDMGLVRSVPTWSELVSGLPADTRLTRLGLGTPESAAMTFASLHESGGYLEAAMILDRLAHMTLATADGDWAERLVRRPQQVPGRPEDREHFFGISAPIVAEFLFRDASLWGGHIVDLRGGIEVIGANEVEPFSGSERTVIVEASATNYDDTIGFAMVPVGGQWFVRQVAVPARELTDDDRLFVLGSSVVARDLPPSAAVSADADRAQPEPSPTAVPAWLTGAPQVPEVDLPPLELPSRRPGIDAVGLVRGIELPEDWEPSGDYVYDGRPNAQFGSCRDRGIFTVHDELDGVEQEWRPPADPYGRNELQLNVFVADSTPDAQLLARRLHLDMEACWTAGAEGSDAISIDEVDLVDLGLSAPGYLGWSVKYQFRTYEGVDTTSHAVLAVTSSERLVVVASVHASRGLELSEADRQGLADVVNAIEATFSTS